ncbi:uncharacterized protein P884DRAFT_266418 [Thermothelomyces heterothallicus CBS 202.75]|uniref:uncharacterized protein n=1 Tax=Thermothelomyces heterothallicus CBS 202.75 TaxID=1149848 RepID=UPI00374240E6
MPTYYNPPAPTRSSAPVASRSISFSQTRRGSNTTAATTSNRSNPSALEPDRHDRPAAGGYEKKFPYLFLGSIAAASLLAHKYWPKGFPHGEKEDWELSDLALRAKHRRLVEKAEKTEKAARQVARECLRRRERRGGGGWCERDCNACDDAAEGLRGRCRGYERGRGKCYACADETYGHVDDALSWERPRDRWGSSTWSARGENRDRDRDRDRACSTCGYSVFSSRPASSRDLADLSMATAAYRPSVPERYLLEQSSSTAGVSHPGLRYYLKRSSSITSSNTGSRVLSSTQQSHCDDSRPGEVYVYRDRPTRWRRASSDMSRDGRHVGGYSWDY